MTGQLPSPPDCFLVAGKLACSAADGALSTRQGKEQEIPGGNKRRRSAGGTFPAPQAPTKEGLDGVERTPRIRRTATKNACKQQVMTGRSSATDRQHPTAGRASGRPFNWLHRNQGEPSEPARTPAAVPWVLSAVRHGTDAAVVCQWCRNGGPPPGDDHLCRVPLRRWPARAWGGRGNSPGPLLPLFPRRRAGRFR